MSVLMRGVDMPKNCEECNFKGECRNYWEKIREAYTRPSWCPLVEVEPMKTTDYCAICKQDMCKDCIADATNPYCVPSHYEMKQAEPKTDNGIGCSKCESRFWCMDRDMPHAVHCNNYGKVTDEPQTEVETMSCAECKHRPIGAEICEEACHYEPQTDWHYDEQDATWYPYKHEDEPQQKSCATCKHALGNWDGESNNCGRCCGADRRFYEPKTEPHKDLLVTEYPQDGEVNLIGRDKTKAAVMAYDVYKELTEPKPICESCSKNPCKKKKMINDIGHWVSECTEFDHKTEPQTLDDIGRQIQDAYDKGIISDADATQAWYEAVNKTEPQTEMEKSGSKAVQTARCLNCHNAKACKENHWEVCKYEPWKLIAVEDEPQTDIGTSDTVYSDTAGYVPRVDMTDCSWKKGE